MQSLLPHGLETPRPSLLSTRRVPALDGLRGSAIALVLAFHGYETWGAAAQSGLGRLVFHVGALGWTGVDLFFVLSGFLISGILIDTRQERHYFRDFFAKRSLRIFPLYYATLLVFFVVLPQLAFGHHALGPDFEQVQKGQVWFWSYLTNWWVGAVLPQWPHAPYLNHLWSLAVEEQFYLVWPLLVRWLPPARLTAAFSVVALTAFVARAAILASGGTPIFVYVSTLTRMDSLAIGGLVAILVRQRNVGRSRRIAALCVLAASALGLTALFLRQRFLDSGDPTVQLLGFECMAIGAASLVYWLVTDLGERSIVSRLLQVRPLGALGRVSYGVYVFHLPIFKWTRGMLGGGNSLRGTIGEWLLAITFTLSLAALSFRFFESKLTALRRFIPQASSIS